MMHRSRSAPLAVALTALFSAIAAPAGAASRPHLSWVRCSSSCHGHTVAPGGSVKLAGHGIGTGMRAMFPVREGGRKVVRAVKTTAAGRGRLLARVPGNAVSGRVYLKVPRGPRTNAVGPIRVQKPSTGGVTSGSPPPSGTAFDGNGMWIWYVSKSSGGDPQAIIAQAQAHGITTLFVKAGDGTNQWAQFSPAFVQTLKAAGLRVCAWQYVYGSNPSGEAAVAIQAVQNGADCFVIDAEKEYEGRYAQAQTYVQQLRAAAGANYPIGLAGFPYVDFHPSFPYSVFLGTNGAQFNVPQAYWKEIGGGLNTVMDHTYRFNRPYGRSLDPLGQVYDNPPASEITGFRQIAAAQGSAGVSWWDWQEAQPYAWDAVGAPIGPYAGPAPASDYATLGNGGKGDLVIWAQQHLESAGEAVTPDGSYGSQTVAAVRDFQTKSGLPVTGQVDTATWQALLRYAPAPVNWKSGAHAASSGARTGPATATLPDKGEEIPTGVGRG